MLFEALIKYGIHAALFFGGRVVLYRASKARHNGIGRGILRKSIFPARKKAIRNHGIRRSGLKRYVA